MPTKTIITEREFSEIMRKSANSSKYVKDINETLAMFNINTKKRVAAFLSQVS